MTVFYYNFTFISHFFIKSFFILLIIPAANAKVGRLKDENVNAGPPAPHPPPHLPQYDNRFYQSLNPGLAFA
jgi:hypothetical protein